MDVMSIESCVQAVVGSYRDASKLVQRLKDKQETSQECILPEQLTRDFEDSLSLGTVAVQSQYDHDVRRFGETYARGDAIAREQMKDILIALQRAIITHLREVYMDEAYLDLHSLKETSDDSRVNATVCLGQLYQRMSTATAAVKQISRPHVDGADKCHMPTSLAYSCSHSTPSSLGGGRLDSQSTTSYTTYSSRTAIGPDCNHSGDLIPQRKNSMASALSYSSEREPPKSLAPGEDNVPALPFFVQRQASQGAVENIFNVVKGSHQGERGPSPDAVAPPPYKPNLSSSREKSGEKGQSFPRESNFYQPLTADIHNSTTQSPEPKEGHRNEPRRALQHRTVQIHELGDGRVPRADRREENWGQTDYSSHGRPVPLNPDYSTLEYVADLEMCSRPPALLGNPQQFQRYMQQPGQQWRLRAEQRDHQQSAEPGQQSPRQPVARLQTSNVEATTVASPVDPVLRERVPTIPLVPRSPSIRSSSSTGSKLGAFSLRKAFPPGIVEAIHKPAPSPSGAQPRYVKLQTPDMCKDQTLVVASPTSQVNSWAHGVSMTAASGNLPSGSTMRPPTSRHVQVAMSELNLPNESNLAGFCKGAVRTQLGSRKKGFSLQHRQGAKGQEYFYQCTKCSFEGPAAVSTALPSGGRGAVKREKTFDVQVRVSEGGIKYRWALLAKSHVSKKAASKDGQHGSHDVFGCYFCCAEGMAIGWVDNSPSAQLATLGSLGDEKTQGNPVTSTTPTFTGLQPFLAHLDTHRTASRTPGQTVANATNCIVGRTADDGEDFDLNLPPLQ